MAHHVFIAFSRPLDGHEQDYDEWYDRQHMPDVLSVPGFVSAQRYDVVGRRPEEMTRPYSRMIVYEIESDDVDATVGELRARIGAGEIATGDLFDPSVLGFYTASASAARQYSKD